MRNGIRRFWHGGRGEFHSPFIHCLPPSLLRSAEEKTRYRTAITHAKAQMPNQPSTLESADGINRILNSSFEEKNLTCEDDDLSGLKAGEEIKMAPVDTGYTSSDVGKLIGLTGREAVISSLTQQGGKEIHIHYPRWNFSFEKV